MIIDIGLAALVVAGISIFSGLIGIVITLRVLVTGSYNEYILKRRAHLDQMRRVQDSIQRNRRS